MKRIVVGVDGSLGSRTAFAWALEEAALRGATLEAVLAWSYLDQHSSGRENFDPGYGEADARAALDEMVDDVAGPDPDVRIVRTVVNDLPARALLEASSGADLIVVGTRGHGGFRGLLLGSVSQQCVTHAACPTVVIPREDDEAG